MIGGAPGRDPARAFSSSLSDVYSMKGTADLGPADSGHDWTLIANDASSRLSVINGKLTNGASAAAVRAGYVVARLEPRVLRIGGRFTLSSTTNPGGGLAAFVIWRTALLTTARIPDSGLHLVVSDTGWSINAWENQAPSATFGGATFTPALVTDGSTVHVLDVTIVGNTATVDPPQGATVDVTDARIGSLAGPYANFEVYQGNASTDTKAAFIEVWAES